jgi:hypothetical protein
MTQGSLTRNGGAEGAGLPLALILALAGVITAAGLGTLREVLSLWDLGRSANPYWLPDHALALYVITPLTALATSLFFLAPGLILAAAFGREKSAALWLLSGFGGAIVVLVAATSAFQLATGVVLTGMGFFYLVLAVNIGALAMAGFRQANGQPMRVELAGQGGDLLMAALVFWAALVLMAPHFYWQSFSADGADSLNVTRQYIQSLWPFWPPEAGVIQSSPSLTSVLFVFPSSWFLRLWGPAEFSLRVPMLMGLSLLYPMLTALIRAARPSAQIGLLTHVLIAAALCLYTLSVAYSGGYHPWFGDSAMPGTRETLAMVCFMGYILAFEQDRRALIMGAAFMSYLSIPTGGLWLLAWPLAVLLVWRPVERGRLIFSVWVLIGAASVAVLLPVLVRLLDLPLPGGGIQRVRRGATLALCGLYRLEPHRLSCRTHWHRAGFGHRDMAVARPDIQGADLVVRGLLHVLLPARVPDLAAPFHPGHVSFAGRDVAITADVTCFGKGGRLSGAFGGALACLAQGCLGSGI